LRVRVEKLLPAQLIAPIGQTIDQAAPRREQAGLFHIHVSNHCRRRRQPRSGGLQTAVLNLAPKAQHSERAWGNAPGWYGKGKPASAESAIQLLVRLFSRGCAETGADSRLQRSLILRLSNPWGDAQANL